MQKLLLFLAILFFLVSCSNDAYETGNSRYSFLRADFAEAQADGGKHLVSALTDNGVSLLFTRQVSSSFVTKADSTYRVLLYYNIGEYNTGESANSTHIADAGKVSMTVEPVSIGNVYVLKPLSGDGQANFKSTDPVHFQSSWISANGNYANLSLALMTGIADSVDNRQSLGLRCDTIVKGGGGHSTYYYTLLHDQGNVPQYYKSTVYISIPTKKMTTGDIVRLSLNTYDGWITREFRL